MLPLRNVEEIRYSPILRSTWSESNSQSERLTTQFFSVVSRPKTPRNRANFTTPPSPWPIAASRGNIRPCRSRRRKAPPGAARGRRASRKVEPIGEFPKGNSRNPQIERRAQRRRAALTLPMPVSTNTTGRSSSCPGRKRTPACVSGMFAASRLRSIAVSSAIADMRPIGRTSPVEHPLSTAYHNLLPA